MKGYLQEMKYLQTHYYIIVTSEKGDFVNTWLLEITVHKQI